MLAYISQNADKRILNALAVEGFETVLLSPFAALCEPTDTHADMLLCAVGTSIFKHALYPLAGEHFINVTEDIGAKYPNDILLNIAIVGTHVFCNEKHASATVLEYLRELGYNIHHVSQGYAHCSTCILSEHAIITADSSIAMGAEKAGIDVLLISVGNISLPPYDYGFIGGASGVCGDRVYFCGSLDHHPDGDKIREFCLKHHKTVVELCDSPLADIGGILFI